MGWAVDAGRSLQQPLALRPWLRNPVSYHPMSASTIWGSSHIKKVTTRGHSGLDGATLMSRKPSSNDIPFFGIRWCRVGLSTRDSAHTCTCKVSKHMKVRGTGTTPNLLVGLRPFLAARTSRCSCKRKDSTSHAHVRLPLLIATLTARTSSRNPTSRHSLASLFEEKRT